MSPIHETAARGFVDGGIYERGRPDYPSGIVDAIGIGPGSVVADLGCGTGKCTRVLLGSGATVTGVEPLPSMRATFRTELPQVPIVAGTAEAIPALDATFDRVVCAAAFHWFDHERALPEIHRVLKGDGCLAIVWNRRDKLTGWAADFWQITERHRGDTPGYRTGRWRDAVDGSPLFGPITEQWFDNVQRTDLDGLLARVASISFIELLPAQHRRSVLDECRRFVESHPDTRGRTVFDLPYRTAVYLTPVISAA